MSITVTALYFRFVSNDWRWLYLGLAILLIALAVPGMLWMPESPKFLYENKRFAECKAVLLKMGRFNGVKHQPLAESLD